MPGPDGGVDGGVDQGELPPDDAVAVEPPVEDVVMQLVTLPLSVNAQGAFSLIAGDTGPARFVQLTDASGQPIVLPEDATVSYCLRRKSTGVTRAGEAVIVLGMLGFVRYDWADPIPSAGQYQEQWQVTFPGGQIVHVPTDGYITLNVLAAL